MDLDRTAPVLREQLGGRTARRALVLAVMAGYPVLVAAWLALPGAGVTGLAWAAIVAALGLGTVGGALWLYRFRVSLAHRPDEQLDERQVAIRDRAYLESYRILSVLLLFGLLAVAIIPDLVDRPLEITFETVQPVLWGAFLYAFILPSAVVAWQEPDLPNEA